ncbi:selenide, water dikinase SelD [Myxococcota bacterium]|nr:selenide, water dikinase SelD [Myxococcota bacterium]
MQAIKLTEFSHGAGCGCKINPALLDTILEQCRDGMNDPRLLVGNSSNDDAAAYDLGNGTSVLSTTDFFMPIVDDPFTFGRIAATNALSDVYAMGGHPLMAISILGWPVSKLDASVARQVVMGGKSACDEAGIPLAGGHSIDSPEPIFGLAVTGLVENRYLKRNSSARAGCSIFLTKPLGIGILTTAQKRKVIEPGHITPAIEAMCALNTIGAALASMEEVVAITDVTGFGLLGHLTEVCEGSNISATVNFASVPLLPNVEKYLEMGCIAGGTRNNFASYGHKIGPMPESVRHILCDSQTSGGLLCFVQKGGEEKFLKIATDAGLSLSAIGFTTDRQEPLVTVV